MTATVYNITESGGGAIECGATYERTLYIENTETGEAFDLTDVVPRAMMREDYEAAGPPGAAPVINLSGTPADEDSNGIFVVAPAGTSGKITMRIGSDETDQLQVDNKFIDENGVWDMEGEDSVTGRVYKFYTGAVQAKKGATR